jgi:protein-tyrosine phosphatase
MYKFAAASENESNVFVSSRPGYTKVQVSEWIEFMQDRGIQRICCLLTQKQLTHYLDLLGNYRQVFGIERVCWAPIEDFSLVTAEILVERILPFLATANSPEERLCQRQNERVVVHCSGGIGRTGHILAAWLVAERGFSSKLAIAAVKKTGRNPYEAAIFAPFRGLNPWQVAAELKTLLNECHD